LAESLAQVVDGDYASRSEAALSIVRDYLNARKMSAEYQALYRKFYDKHATQS
jgi:metal-responsive CopG/Arc/MetJ family transcriptional regulator